MRYGVLGPVAVWTDGGTPVTVPGVKVRALLADLLLHEGRAVPSDRLLDDLWGESLPGNPAGTLSAKVSQLRRALADAEPGGRELVAARPPGYQLHLAADAVDAQRFQEMITRAQHLEDPVARAELLADALALWRGPAYADFADEPFTQAAAARLEELRLTAYEEHAEARLALGDHAMLIGDLADLLARHPLRERLRAAHMRALYGAGRQSEALESFTELRTRLADELGLDPGADLVALHASILGQDPSLEVRPRARTNLPVPLTGLIGRDDAVTDVRARLETGRLVTLTGPGGVGKTRLAVETAGAFADEAWMVELAAETGELPDAVLTALDIRDAAGQAPLERLTDALRPRSLLLVLDNCEHVIELAAELAGALLQAVPELRILATSREPLGLPGEVVWEVPPLAPDAAVELFVERASAASRGFALDDETAEPVGVLCRRLDGIPLALELAATRVRALGVSGLVARLDDRLRLLATGHRGAPPRQQTLLAMIGWSWDLLTPPEQVVLRRLAVHSDGWTLEAAESVCADEEVPAGQVLDLLARLVDRSLVVMADQRYRLLESVAAYCTERLADADETGVVRDRHRDYYLRLAERAEPHLYGPEQRQWLRRLDAEAANLRVALDGADAESALRMVNALAWYWHLRGRLTEARRSLDAALSLGDDATAKAWRAGFAILLGEGADLGQSAGAGSRAVWFMGWVGTDTGDLVACETLLAQADAAFHATGDRWGQAAVLVARAKIAHVRGDLAALERDCEHAAKVFGELGDRWGWLQAASWLSALAEMTGDHERARDLQRQAIRLAEELELWTDVAGGLGWLGWIALQQGDFTQAREYCEQAMRMAVEQDHKPVQIFAEMGLGFAARKAGDLDTAEIHLRNLVAAAPSEGLPPLYLPMVLAELGFAAEQRGDAATALTLQLEAYATGSKLEGARDLLLAIEGMAGALTLAGHHTEAARLLGSADAGRRSSGLPTAPAEQVDLDRITENTRKGLGEEPFATAFTQGAELTPAQAHSLAASHGPQAH